MLVEMIYEIERNITMRSKFDEQLQNLNNEMIEMGNRIVSAISQAISALSKKDSELAEIIMKQDTEIDHMQKEIENICFDLLIQQQPVAKDLRIITAAMKMVTDMERIGDHAADISEMTILMGDNSKIDRFDHIGKMAAETMLMLNQSIEAYVNRNQNEAKAVINYDDIVDDLFCKVKREIIQMIRDNPEEGEDAADLLMVAKYFERIGDHATNIAEWVIYSLKTSETGNEI